MSEDDRAKLEHVRKKIKLKRNLDSSDKAEGLLNEVTNILSADGIKSALSLEELKVVGDEWNGNVRCSYGIVTFVDGSPLIQVVQC